MTSMMQNSLKIELYEGYIRNRKKLCEELSLVPGKSREETERAIIAAAFRRWGHSFCRHLFGAFCLVIRDEVSGELFCARDQLGLKSLFYYLTKDGTLLYGASPGAVAEDKRYQPEPDLEALQIYMMFGYPAGEKTLYKGISKLPPGSCLLFRNGYTQIHEYDRLDFHPDYARTEDDWIRDIESTLEKIIREDQDNFSFGQAGSFLSGGVDSSYLLALSGVRRTYGIGYEEADCSETNFAGTTAAYLGAEFSEIRITADDFFRTLPEVIKGLGLPVADPSAAVFAMGCSRLAGLTDGPMLSGEGADEFLAGYHIYRRSDQLALTGGPLHFGCAGTMDAEPARQLLMLDRAFPCDGLVEDLYLRTESAEHLSRLLLIDLRLWFEGDILFCVDRASRAGGFDLLLPYADRRFFELTSSIPSSMKLRDGVGKYILRRAAEKKLPHETAFRKKVGFSVPVKDWLRQDEFRPGLEAVLFGPRSGQYFDRDLLRRYWQSFLGGSDGIWRIIYSAYVFLIWEADIFTAK